MKKKMLLILLAVTVSVATIAAATMAWFTDDATAGDAIFTAGTVIVEAGDATIVDNVKKDNVNPGDCFEVEWLIENKGTKAIVFKGDLSAKWTDLVTGKGYFPDGTSNEITMANLTIKIWDGTQYVDPKAEGTNVVGDWTLEGSGNDLNNYTIYYTGAPIKGTYYSVPLKIQICFDGELTHNGYQGATFTLGGTVTAVQASNGAPNAQFGVDYYDYLQASDLSANYLLSKPNHEQDDFVTVSGDGLVNITFPGTTYNDNDGFYNKYFATASNGKFSYKVKNLSTNKTANYDLDFSSDSKYAYVHYVIDMQKLADDGLEISKIVKNGVEITAPTYDTNYYYFATKIAQNNAVPLTYATLEDWEKSAPTNDTVLLYMTDGSIYKVNVIYY